MNKDVLLYLSFVSSLLQPRNTLHRPCASFNSLEYHRVGVVLTKNGRGPKNFPRAARAIMHSAPPPNLQQLPPHMNNIVILQIKQKLPSQPTSNAGNKYTVVGLNDDPLILLQ